MGKTTSTGKETLAYCTSCKMDLAHTIVAMQGDRIIKAECKTCKKEHAYRAPKGVTEPPKEKVKKTRAKAAKDEGDQSSPIEVEWQKLMAAHKGGATKTYSTKAHFILGDKIAHTQFGEGIINRMIYPNKVEVIFQRDVKVLVHQGNGH